MKRLILILSVMIVSSLGTVCAAVSAEANDLFKKLATELNTEGMTATWNGSNLIINTAPAPSLTELNLDAEDMKMLKKSFAEGVFSSGEGELIDTLRTIMRENNIHIIINIIGAYNKKVCTVDITWRDF